MSENKYSFDSQASLKNHFLIAMPSIKDSSFSRTVTYVCDHNEYGAMGIIINQPLKLKLSEVFEQLSLEYCDEVGSKPALSGGPVKAQRGFVLHRDEGTWDSTLRISSEVCLTASKDIMAAMADNAAPSSAQFALGYAGWEAGQLESEISENSWLTTPADTRILFDVPVEERWNAASQHLGIDLNLIVSTLGHA